MDKKDEIILQQLDVIRTMTQNNLNRMGSDFWGAPLTPNASKGAAPKARAEARCAEGRRRRKAGQIRYFRRRRGKKGRGRAPSSAGKD